MIFLNTVIKPITKTLTICIPTYNRKTFLSRLLKNIENNCLLYNEIEVIVVDDGSTDGTEYFIKNILFRFKFIIILTEILRKIPLIFYPNEKRLPSSIVWFKLSSFTDVVFINSKFITKNYTKHGLSKNNLLKNRINSPNNSLSIYSTILELNNYSSILFRIKASINYWRFYYHGATKQNIVFPIKNYFLIHYLLAPLGYLYSMFDKLLSRSK